jgi:UDP-glucose 4-epimerase
MAHYLVTGGAGFIGSHLAEVLVERGDSVVVLDDLSGGVADRVPDPAQLVVGTVCDPDTVAEVFDTNAFDGVFHLAAFAAEGISHAVKRLNYTSNIIGSVNLVNAAITHKVPFFGYSSSVAVYGKGQTPMRETDLPTPHDSYGNAKLAVERELEITMRMQGLPYFAMRMHNVYGEWQNMRDPYRNAVAIFLNQIMRDEPITVYGDGQQVRAFTYVRDIVGTFVAAAHNPAAWGKVFNVGSSKTATVLELAHAVRDAMGVPDHPIMHLPEREEVKVAYTDSSFARATFGDWVDTPMLDGVQRTAAWARAQGPAGLATKVELEIPQTDPSDWVGWIRTRLGHDGLTLPTAVGSGARG